MKKNYSIVETDNFDGDYPGEKFCGPPLAEVDAQKIAGIFNAAVPAYHRRYWKVVELPYRLQPDFEP